MKDLRNGVAQLMRENEHVYGKSGNFDAYGGYQRYCDLVSTCGVYVEGNAEIPATADYISRHILILGADEHRDVFVFAGSIGNGAPVQLDNESPIIVAHYRTSQHYTGTAPCDAIPWSAPRGSKRARIKELHDFNIAEAAASANALASLISRSRAIADEARSASTFNMSTMLAFQETSLPALLPASLSVSPPSISAVFPSALVSSSQHEPLPALPAALPADLPAALLEPMPEPLPEPLLHPPRHPA